MTDPFCPSASPTLPGPTDWRAADIPAIIARLLALAMAHTGDRDEAEDLVQETLIAAWQGGESLPPADLGRLLTERCHCWQACRRAARAALGRLIAAGDPLPPWLTGSSGDADGEAIVELVVLRLTIAERLRRPPGDRGASMQPAAPTAGRTPGPTVFLPAIPADLAAARPIAAALVRAGATTRPATTPNARRRRCRRAVADHETAPLTAAMARHDRLQAQVRERERAVERSARCLDTARHQFDHTSPPQARAAAEAALAVAAVRHERALAARRDLAHRLADLLHTPGLTAALARRERTR